MQQDTILLLSAAAVILSVLAAVLAWVTSIRWSRAQHAAMERTAETQGKLLRNGEDKIAALDQQVAFLKELDSVRFAQRYLDTKYGLEARLEKLQEELRTGKERGESIRRQVEQLSAADQQKDAEIRRLRAELVRVQQEAQRLEQIIQSLHTVGPIPIADLKGELTKRLRVQAEIKSQIEKLGLDGMAKVAELERLEMERVNVGEDIKRVERELEIARSAGPILDGLLGISAEMQQKLTRIGERLEESLWRLGAIRPRDPIAELRSDTAVGTPDRGRLLLAGLFAPTTPATENQGRGEQDVRDPETDGPSAGEGLFLPMGAHPRDRTKV